MLDNALKQEIRSYSGIFQSPPENIPSKTITDAPLLGNGDLGVAIGGNGEQQNFFFSKNDFWYLTHLGETSEQRLDRLLHDRGRRTGTRILVLGQLVLTIPSLKGCSYFAEQDILHGQVNMVFQKNDLRVEMCAWVSGRSDDENLFLLSVKTNQEIRAEAGLSPGEYGEYEVYGYEDILEGKHHYITYSPNTANVPGRRWAAVSLRIVGAQAEYTLDLDKTVQIRLEPHKEHYFCVAAASDLDSPTPIESVCELTDSLTVEKIKERKKLEEEWWERFYSSSDVFIQDPVIMKYYYSSLYLLGCCTRGDEPLPGIFGNWITTDRPLWTGSYTLNYNYEAPFWELETANHPEMTSSYPDTLMQLIPLGKEFAKYFLGKKGMILPIEIGPFGTICCMQFHNQRTNAAYASVNMIRHFYYTWDEAYARRVYPFLQAVCEFWEDYLVFEDGRYNIYNDCVHEEYISTGDKNNMMALGLVRYLFQGTMTIARELDWDREKWEKWGHILTHLSGYTTFEKDGKCVFRYTEIGRDWRETCPVTIQTIYPLGMFPSNGDPQQRQIAKNTFEARDNWEDENKFCAFFAAGARIGHDPADLLERLHAHCIKFGQTNGFIHHKGGGIENCNGVLSCLHEMMLQSYEGIIRVFPNWPQAQDASFHHLRAQGAFLISSTLKQGEVEFIEIKSEKGRPFTLEVPWRGEIACFRNGVFERTLKGGVESFDTEPGDIIFIRGKG